MSPFIIIGLFVVKVLVGCINLYLHNHVFPHSDVSFFYWQSIGDIKEFNHSPKQFLNEWLLNWGDISNRLNFFNKENAPFWNNLGSLFHSKYMTLANILSFGHFYVNVIFYNIVFFWGQLLLYKTFYKINPEKKWLFLISIFMIPSVLFWCSGIHKDGWILTSIGILSYATLQYFDVKKIKYLIAIILSLLCIFLVRYFYFICIVPPYIIWLYSHDKKNKMQLFGFIYSILITFFFTIKYILPRVDPMKLVSNKQIEFLKLEGFSSIYTPQLENNIWSYVQNLPNCLYHIFLVPFFSLSDPLKYQLASLDSLFVFTLIIVSFIYIKKKYLQHDSFYLFSLFLSLTVYIIIGYTISNSGALVRYKSEFTAILLPTLIGLSEIPFLKRFYSKEKLI